MSWLAILGWITAAIAFLPALYALHRLGLRLEDRGYVYYWHKQSQTSAFRAFDPLQEMIQPQIRHVIEAEEHQHVDQDDRESEPERSGAWWDRSRAER